MSGQSWTCETCGQRLRGHWAHCGGCCLTFSGVQPFDRHFRSLTNAGCRPESELPTLVNRKTQRVFSSRELDGVTVWQTYSEVPTRDVDGGGFAARMAEARAG